MPKRRADGRICKTMTDPRTGKRVYFYGETEREVNRKIMEYQGKVADGRTFREVADEWWEDTEPSLSPNSVKGYNIARKRAVEWFGDTPIGKLARKDLQQAINRFASLRYAKKTVSNQRLIICQIFKHAVAAGDVDHDISRDVILPKGLPQKKRTALTREEEQIVKSSADVWLLPFLVLYTGLRLGEALALTGADIDIDEKQIYVTKSVYFDHDSAGKVKSPKTEAGIRCVPILKPLEPLLPTLAKDEYLFPSGTDPKKPMGKAYYNKVIKRYRNKVGATFGIHQIRHSYATMLYELGIDAKTAQHLLGHAQLSTTMDIYTDFRSDRVKVAADTINAKL